ncbi:glycosyltransferase family 4 protein [Rhodobacter calidifons]|uniref:Glycosyltransferase family 4 protein n=1 Tax=Rhodobacter calidifons TaxID=2715277 RepID=A0ABX0G710_9RHOB|nr:glycosyltransferase family 4 protein [Rhodobacter calidifons]NHB77050.1 glycosyltransferase family 4 protein [Rhodobacter calidifons]
MTRGSELRPLRVAFVTPAWPGVQTPNGIATAVSHLASGLQDAGHEVTIIAHWLDAPHDHPRVIALPDARLRLVDRLRRKLDPEGWQVRFVADQHVEAIRRAVALYGVEVVVMEETQGWVGEIRAKVSVPVVATLHGPWWLHRMAGSAPDDAASARREAREARGLRRVDGITSPSNEVLRQTEARWGLPKVPAAVIPNPFPAPAQGIDLTDELLNHVLFVGRFDHIKGGDIVVDAFASIAAAHPAAQFTFVGPDEGLPRAGGGIDRLSDRLARLPEPVRSRIRAVGRQSRAEVAALRARHGVTLVASRYENFGGTLIEAMAVGSAVVSTSVGGQKEIATHEETALMVPPEDAEAMARACLRLMRDPALARRLGAAARNHVKANYAPDVIARRMADFLASVRRQ